MNEKAKPLTQLSIDLKKFRIRIYKETLHSIGDPNYIQILVHVRNRQIAIIAVENEQVDLQSYKVDTDCMDSDLSFEIYSKPFIKRLCSEFNCFDKGRSYRLTGSIISSEKIAVFPLDSAQKIDGIWESIWKRTKL